VIAPTVRMVDLDPEAFAHVERVLSSRDRSAPAAVTVLHDGRRALRVVHNATGELDVALADAGVDDDRAAQAAELRMRLGVDSVTFVDRSRLDDLGRELVALGRTCSDQGELLWRARELWSSHPAIAIDPPPGPSRWPAVAARLRSLDDGSWIEVVATRAGGAEPWRLAARVEAGLLVEITSAPPAGPVAWRVEAPLATLDAVLLADDPLAALDAAGAP
jgi:hypothetical protein